jgi:Na+-driven multidrug efflux pump
VLIEQVLHLLVGLVDMWLTGNLLGDEAYVAAMTLVIYALWLVGNLFSFIAVGSTALTARFTGAGDRETANRVMNQSLTTGFLWSGVVMAFAIPLAGQFAQMMGWRAWLRARQRNT